MSAPVVVLRQPGAPPGARWYTTWRDEEREPSRRGARARLRCALRWRARRRRTACARAQQLSMPAGTSCVGRPVRRRRDARGRARVDPGAHSTRRAPSSGSSRGCRRARSSSRGRGPRVAIVKQDLYIAQDCSGGGGADPRARRLRDRQAQPDDGGDPQPLVALLLVAVLGGVGVPGRLRPALLRVLRQRSRRRSSSIERLGRCGSAPRDAVTPTCARLDGPAVADDGTPAATRRRHRQRHDRRALRLRAPGGGSGGDARQLGAAPRDARGRRPDLRGLRRPVRADGRPRDRRRDRLDAERRRHRRARAQPQPLVPRAAEYTHRQYAQAERGARLLADDALARRRGGRGRTTRTSWAPSSR